MSDDRKVRGKDFIRNETGGLKMKARVVELSELTREDLILALDNREKEIMSMNEDIKNLEDTISNLLDKVSFYENSARDMLDYYSKLPYITYKEV